MLAGSKDYQNYQNDAVSYQLTDVGRGGGSMELPVVKPSKYLSTYFYTHVCSNFALKTLWGVQRRVVDIVTD
jgi:hypothetical protein